MNKRVCPHCNKEFECNGKVFSNHVRWCSENPNKKTYQVKISEINYLKLSIKLMMTNLG